MAKSEASDIAVAILGMHRSGTSLITRVVSLLGAYLGEDDDLMQARPDNPEGFWEHRRVYAFHERLLRALGRSWDTAIPLSRDWQKSPEIAPFRDELLELIETQFGGRPIWAWKDPRTCILLPLWKDVLAELNIELSCLLVTRNPLDVARSLAARNDFSLDDGFGLWFNHSLAMLQNSAGSPRTVVRYQKFLVDPEASIVGWAPRLSLKWSQQDEAWPDVLRQVVRKDLCHSASSLSDLPKAGCPKPVVELARILAGMAKTGDAEGSAETKKIARLLEDHQSRSRLYSHDFVKAQAVIHELHREREEQQAIIRDARTAANEQQAIIRDARTAAKERQQELTGVQSQMTQTQQQLVLGQAQCEMIERELGKREQELAKGRALSETVEQQLTDREQELAAARTRCETVERQLAERGQELAKARAQCETVEQQLGDREQELAKARTECEVIEAQLREHKQELVSDREKRDTLKRQLQEKEREVLDTQDRIESYEQHLQAVEARLDDMTKSYSWRMTRPLRGVFNFFKSSS